MARIILIGAPLDDGQPQQGCVMGPAAFRIAGLGKTLATLGHQVEDRGDVTPAPADPAHVSDNPAIRCLPQVIAWTQALADAAESAMAEGMPIFLGGDHAMSLGSLAGVARHADRVGRPLFILWLDAHSDFHNLRTTQSGNLHGTSLGYAAGLSGFLPFPPFPAPVPTGNICLFGIRSLDPAEQQFLTASDVIVNDMRVLDERGVVAPLREFLGLVAKAGGLLHVSLDVDFLDPAIAPAVGTTVPGGATLREAHLVMEMLHESGLVTSLDLAELNPFLDERGRTARLMVDLAASLMGRKVFDRPTAPML